MINTQARLHKLLNNAKKIALTEEEHKNFVWMNENRDFANLSWWVGKVSERTGIPLSSGRIAHDSMNKQLLVVD